jgi:hypothetical protein
MRLLAIACLVLPACTQILGLDDAVVESAPSDVAPIAPSASLADAAVDARPDARDAD